MESPIKSNVEIKNNAKKKFRFFDFSLLRISILFILLSASYLFFREIEESKKPKTTSNESEILNSEEQIIDISIDHSNDLKDKNIEDFAVNTIQEKSAEFIYRSIIRNQEEIRYLKEQNQILKNEFTKFKNRENLAKIIFLYIDFRKKFFSAKDSQQEFVNIQTASVLDKDLYDKINKFSQLKKDFVSNEKILQNFSLLIPELIAIRSSNHNDSLLSKVKYFFAKLIVIRKINGENISQFDQTLLIIEQSIKDQNYSEAMVNLLKFDQKYHSVLAKILQDLSTADEAQKIDEEILSYLKNLS